MPGQPLYIVEGLQNTKDSRAGHMNIDKRSRASTSTRLSGDSVVSVSRVSYLRSAPLQLKTGGVEFCGGYPAFVKWAATAVEILCALKKFTTC